MKVVHVPYHISTKLSFQVAFAQNESENVDKSSV